MKFLNDKITTTIFIIMGLIWSSGCSSEYIPDCGCNCEYHNLWSEIPYKEGSILKFKDTLGNKLAFTLKKSSYRYLSESGNGGDPDCGAYTVHWQLNENFFEEELGRKNLLIFNIAYSPTNFKISNSLEIVIDSTEFSYYTSTKDLSESGNFVKQITLNGKNYNNVAITEDFKRRETKIYYNSQIGIISFKTDSVQWYLDN